MPGREIEFDGARAETTRRRARVLVALLVVLWVPLMLFADPQNYGSTRAGLWSRLPTMAVLLIMAAALSRARSRRAVEVAVVAALGFLFVVWGRVVMVCHPLTVTSNMLSIIACAMAISVALLMSWPSTAVLCLTAIASMLVGGLLREPRPERDYFMLVSVAFVVYPMVIFAAASRDRWQRAELDARYKLREANEQLRREHEARSRLFVNLSHDFRTPLAVVRSTVEILRMRGVDTELGTALDRIDGNAASIVDLIDQLLELARLDAAKTPVSPRACDVVAVAAEVAAQLQPARADVRIEARAELPGVRAHVDPSHLRRILQNLVANALRQIAAQGGEVRVEVGRDETGAARVDVVDSGAGVPPELRETLFDRFASFRPEGGTASGIGLALARELARLNAGGLELVAGTAQTTFRLTLPAGDAMADLAVSAAAVVKRATPPAITEVEVGGTVAAGVDSLRPRVLVVEDNDDLRASLVTLLASRFEVEAVAGVAAARRALAARVPSAVVSDIMLPDGVGYELLSAVRGALRFDRVPVLLLTARGETAERVRGLAAGADDYIAKPFAGDELVARIAAAIRRAEERSAAIERQREDLLMELHDGVCGTLARAVLALDRASANHPQDGVLAGAVVAVREGLGEARGILASLTSSSVPWEEAVAQLRWESSGASERAGLSLQLDAFPATAGPGCVSPAALHALRRIASEAITNAARHGSARAVRLRLEASGGQLRLRAEDDGSGCAGAPQPGHGLSSVRRRATRLGGGASFANGAKGGFSLEAWLPLQPDERV